MAMDWMFNPAAAIGSGLDFLGGMMQMNQQASQHGMQVAMAREQMDRDNTRFWDQNTVNNWMADRNENFQREAWGRQFEQALHMQAGDQGFAREMFGANTALQREFANNGIQMKVDDARRAGLHPLFALGGGASYTPSPISVGSSSPSLSATPSGSGGGGIGQPGLPSVGGGINPFAGMGQDLSRALVATQSSEDRMKDALHTAALEKNAAEIELLKTRTALARSQIGPGLPTGSNTGRGVVTTSNPAADMVTVKPAEITSRSSEDDAGTAGLSASRTWVKGNTGVYAIPTKDMNIDEMTSPRGLTWQMDNTILPFISARHERAAKPPDSLLHQLYPHAVRWQFNAGVWEPQYISDLLGTKEAATRSSVGEWLRKPLINR